MQQTNKTSGETLMLKSVLLGTIVYLAGSLTMLGGIALIPSSKQSIRSKAALNTIQLVEDNVSTPSEIVSSGEVLQGTVYSDQQDPLMTISSSKGTQAVSSFMKSLEKTEVPAQALTIESNVQGVTSDSGESGTTVLPAGFSDTAKLTKVVDEKKDLGRIGLRNAKHYYYEQHLKSGTKDLPLYASSARFDTFEESGGSELQGVGVSVVLDTSVTAGNLSSRDAMTRAIEYAQQGDFSQAGTPVLCPQSSIKTVAFNRRLMNLSDDDTNYEAYSISLCNNSVPILIANDYIVSRVDGEILHVEPQVHDVLNRTINNFTGGRWQTGVRVEGGAATGNSEVDNAYDLLGRVYNYYKDNHGRDSYDGRGSKLQAGVNYNGSQVSGQPGPNCPNAFWYVNQMYACKGYVEANVWGHEITHGVIQYTAGLGNTGQAGTLNEGIADIFGWAVDPSDWSMGNVRRMDDPTRSQSPRSGQPDRISSSKFLCAQGQQPSQANDMGGVHINNGVVIKAFYLMVHGDSFNGCTIHGSDPKKVLDVIYKSLTYLSPTSTFTSFYSAVNRACDQVLGASSTECANIKLAMQATDLDQTMGSSCHVNSQPTCAGQSGGIPTTPQPTSGQTTPIPSSGTRPSQVITQKVPTIGISQPQTYPTAAITKPAQSSGPIQSIQYLQPCTPSGSPTNVSSSFMTVAVTCTDGRRTTLGDGQTCQPESVLQQRAMSYCQNLIGGGSTDSTTSRVTPAPTSAADEITPFPRGDAPPQPDSKGEVKFAISAKFQGIKTIPTTPRNTMLVKVSFVGGPTKTSYSQIVTFTAGQGGIWHAETSTDLAPGRYVAYIKGSHHIQRKLCELTSIETSPGTYVCNNNTIPVVAGLNTLDFSRIDQLACDIPVNRAPQNGVCNGQDIAYIRNNMGSQNPAIIDPCDVNRDGVCNAQDYSLVLQALSVKNDE